MKRSILSILNCGFRIANFADLVKEFAIRNPHFEISVRQTRRAKIPLGLIAFDVNILPGKQRSRIRIHSFHVWFLHPVNRGVSIGIIGCCVQHVFFGFSQQFVTFLGVESAIGFVEHRDVFRIEPARATSPAV